jgi:hypothetical protein
MKDVGLKLKNLTRKTSNFLTEHEVTVYFSIILTVIFVTFWVSQEVSHAKKILQVKRENTLLNLAVDDYERAVEDQFEVINIQGQALNKYDETLDQVKGALNDQNSLINDLISYLKKIGHWPPKEPRPNSGRSEAAYIEKGDKL